MTEQPMLPNLGDVEVDVGVDVDRDTYCTPQWLWEIPLRARRVTEYGLDPCTNERSTVPALRKIIPPEDGLSLLWARESQSELIWLNPPYSNVGPWLALACAARDVGFEVWGVIPHAPNIGAWRACGPDFGWSLGRVAFEPPPGVQPANNAMQEHDLVLWSKERPPAVMIPRRRPNPYFMVRVRETVVPERDLRLVKGDG